VSSSILRKRGRLISTPRWKTIWRTKFLLIAETSKKSQRRNLIFRERRILRCPRPTWRTSKSKILNRSSPR
jgi:hypothetical protein